MPIKYFINTEFNIILFIGNQILTGVEYFKAANQAYHDEKRKWGMTTIIDVLSAEADFEVNDMHIAIKFANELAKKGVKPEPVIILTYSKGIRLATEAIKLLPSKVPIVVDVVSNIDDLISALGFSERREEFLTFYGNCKKEASP